MSKDTFGTGAQRDQQEGRGRFDLISPHALLRLAKRCEEGAKHYGERNWEKGIPMSRCLNSCFRHIIAYLRGDRTEDHLAAIMWNAAAMIHYEEEIAAGRLDDSIDDVSKKPVNMDGDL